MPCEVSAQLTASKFKLHLCQEIFTVSPGNVIFKHFKLLIKTTTQLLFFMLQYLNPGLNTHVSLNTKTAVLGFNIRRQGLGSMCKYHICSHISEPCRLLSSEFAALMLPKTRQDTALPPSIHKPLHKCQQQDLEEETSSWRCNMPIGSHAKVTENKGPLKCLSAGCAASHAPTASSLDTEKKVFTKHSAESRGYVPCASCCCQVQR